MVGWMVGSAAAAQYNVAFTVLMALYLAPSVVNQKYLLPKLHRWASHDPAQLRPVCYFTSLAMLVAGLLATAALLVLVDETLPRLFGARYRDAAALLKILALAVPTRYVSLVLGAFLTTRHHVRRKVMLQAITAGINVALNSVLIPRHGAHGAAIATVVTEAVLLAVYVAAVRHQISLPTLEMKELSAKPAGSSG
jgi:O-antigen/teichoic acid export membrane protein